MKFIEKIYNSDNLTLEEIDEKTTRARAIIINSNNEAREIQWRELSNNRNSF